MWANISIFELSIRLNESLVKKLATQPEPTESGEPNLTLEILKKSILLFILICRHPGLKINDKHDKIDIKKTDSVLYLIVKRLKV